MPRVPPDQLLLGSEATVIAATHLPRTYGVSKSDRGPLLEFMLNALRADGCKILSHSPPTQAPFRIAFETASGERMGVVAYAFRATFTPTKNRPVDEHSFQVKYGSKDGKYHPVWTDPFGLYTTLFCGINPDQGFFVGADPQMHNPTRFFIRVEFKQRHVDEILKKGWFTWERDRRLKAFEPVEVLVGGTAQSFLRYIRFEREAQGLDQGHRQLLAEKIPTILKASPEVPPAIPRAGEPEVPTKGVAHKLSKEFQLSDREVLDLIEQHRRLKMAVRGWVAEEQLVRVLEKVPGVSDCKRLDEEGGPDVSLRFKGRGPVMVECKNVLRQTGANGVPRLDFQKTRSAKGDPCSRFYRPDQFDVVAACLHAITEKWEFRYICPTALPLHKKCDGRIAPGVKVAPETGWSADPGAVFGMVAGV